MASVLVIGSSQVNRFQQYINNHPAFDNFNLNGHVTVSLIGISGGRIENNNHCLSWENEIIRVSPNRVLVQIGGNDLDCGEAGFSLAEEIILRIISVCSTYLSRHNVEHATVMQLLPRTQTRNCTVARYNNLVRHANKFVKEQIKSVPGLHYWNIYGVKYTTVNISRTAYILTKLIYNAITEMLVVPLSSLTVIKDGKYLLYI
jgi:hypothetical protein